MPTERALLPGDISYILAWAKKWKAIPTRKEIARKLNVSEATVTRIVKNGGYIQPKRRKAGVASASVNRSESFASHQSNGATQEP